MSQIIPFQPHLHAPLPAIQGNLDYRQLRDLLFRIDQLLLLTGLEDQFIDQDLQRWIGQQKKLSPRAQQSRQLHSRRALRCNLARSFLNEDFRGFAARLADSPLLQHFCALDELGLVQIPAKSTLQRYATWWPETEVRPLVQQLTQLAAQQPAQLHLEKPLDLDCYFLDTTCLEAHIHYPVDWILLRDASRTLTKALDLIRNQGLRHRMETPEKFRHQMNQLCIEMTHTSSKTDTQRHRKRVFRKIDRLIGTIRGHAKRHRDLLDRQWEKTEWTRPQAEQVLGRIDGVLQLLPQARQQARQRIISEQKVDNQDKILSLYEPDTRVIVRHKAGAEVEFGNTLLLGENQQGVILDWKLFQESAPGDVRLLLSSVDRVEQQCGQQLKAAATDRGFDSAQNQAGLKKRGIYNGLCPRSPQELKERTRSGKFKKLQKRRGQIEGRIAILKNNFLGRPLRSKGFRHRNLSLSWAVLTHNLWVLARLPQPPPMALAA